MVRTVEQGGINYELLHAALLRADTVALVLMLSYRERKKKTKASWTLNVWQGWHGDGSDTHTGSSRMSCGDRQSQGWTVRPELC